MAATISSTHANANNLFGLAGRHNKFGSIRPLPDAVLTAMERPDVKAARLAFLGFVDEATDGAMLPSHHYDMVLLGAIRHVTAALRTGPVSVDRTVDKAIKLVGLVELYCAFVDALAPFQPDASAFGSAPSAPSAPTLPWEDTDDDCGCRQDGKVFYFLPGFGGYWVEGSGKFRTMLESIEHASTVHQDL